MSSSEERAHSIFDLYNQTTDLTEFIHVMKNKTDLCDGDVELLWYLISISYNKGFNDNYDF